MIFKKAFAEIAQKIILKEQLLLELLLLLLLSLYLFL
jgi:hypothetical protein